VLLDGLNHAALLTQDTDRLHAFYTEVFEATVAHDQRQEQLRFSIVDVGPHTELNVFELHGGHPVPPQVPMFGRGRLDHIGFQAASLEAFEEIRQRLLARGRATSSSPTLVPSSASSSATPTDWKRRSASPIRTPRPECSTRQALRPLDTCRADAAS
jgi:catechol 2,3-dioxygenase-like lactoylglutathione lyase family enzyme